MGVRVCSKHRKFTTVFILDTIIFFKICSCCQIALSPHVLFCESHSVIHFFSNCHIIRNITEGNKHYSQCTYFSIFCDHSVLYVVSQIHNRSCEMYRRLIKERPYHVNRATLFKNRCFRPSVMLEQINELGTI